MAYNGIGVALLSYMQKHENQIVTIDELENFFKDRFEHGQLMGNMANLMKTPAGEAIERLQTGMWRYKKAVDKTPETTITFELVRRRGDTLLIIDEDDTLYRATPIRE